jgi:hypothetical protein
MTRDPWTMRSFGAYAVVAGLALPLGALIHSSHHHGADHSSHDQCGLCQATHTAFSVQQQAVFVSPMQLSFFLGDESHSCRPHLTSADPRIRAPPMP